MQIAGLLFLSVCILPVASLAIAGITAEPDNRTSACVETASLPEQAETLATIIAPEPTESAAEPTPEAEPEPEYILYDVPLSDELQRYAQDLCDEYSFPRYDIIIALVGAESSYRADAISKTNDYGYMQINTCNHDWLQEQFGALDFTDAKDNLLCGIYMLDRLYDKYEDIGLTLMAYNCGESGARKLWDKGIYSTTYSRTVQQRADELEIKEDEIK